MWSAYVWDMSAVTCLGRQGTGRVEEPRQGWHHSCAVAVDAAAVAAAGRNQTPPGRCCRLGVCPGAGVYCPPWWRVLRLVWSSLCLTVVSPSKLNSGYLVCECPHSECPWLTHSGRKHAGNRWKTLRKNETSSLSMRQLCLRRRNSNKNVSPCLWLHRREWSESFWLL